MLTYYEFVDFSPLETTDELARYKITKEKVIAEISKNGWEIKPADLGDLIAKAAAHLSKGNIASINSIPNFFFGQLKKFSRGEFTDVEGAQTQADEELAAMKQKLLQQKAQREQMKQDIMDLSFDEWWDLSTEEQRKELAPAIYTMSKDPTMIRRGVRGRWEAQIWPQSLAFAQLQGILAKSSNSLLKAAEELANQGAIGENSTHE